MFLKCNKKKIKAYLICLDVKLASFYNLIILPEEVINQAFIFLIENKTDLSKYIIKFYINLLFELNTSCISLRQQSSQIFFNLQ